MKIYARQYYTKRGLIDAVRIAKRNPNAVFVFKEFGLYDKTAKEYLRWFLDSLHKKINRNDIRTGRKFVNDYQIGLLLDARYIREYKQNGVRHSGCKNLLRTKEMQKRFPEINNQEINY